MSATAIDATDTRPYEKMTPVALRAELERLDVLCVKQQLQIKQLTDGTLAMMKDFSVAILAHMNGDQAGVHAGLDAIVKKYVIVTPSPEAMH